ncbi:MAG: ATP-binding protein [Vicinamibacterales bacterium]
MASRVSKQSAAARKLRADAFARFFEAVREGVFIGTLSPDGTSTGTTAANPHLRHIFGYPPDTSEGTVSPLSPGRFVEQADRAALLDRLMADGRVTDYRIRMKRVDGTTFWVETTAQAESEPDGSAIRVEALFRDVSERKRLNDESWDMYQQMLQAEKMAALGQEVATVAHELTNPLATILSWAERLASKPLSEPTQRGVEIIVSEADRAAKTVRQLLTYARKRRSTRTLIDLTRVVQQALASRAYERGVVNVIVETHFEERLPRVFADAHRIYQVLLNLIINAEQAMIAAHGRGTLVVRTSHDAATNMVAVEIADDGPGVPLEVENRIFEPFFTTKEVGQGTGLGLSLAHAIVQEHEGRISVRPSVPRGATFVVELPIAESLAGGASAEPETPFTTLRGASVLLVEDERPLAAAVVELLRDHGLIVEWASDGERALERVQHGLFDVVICDLRMPRLDGMAFYRAMTATRPELARRVIFVTGDVADPEAERFLAESECRWLAKPFRNADLLRRVRDTLA